MDKKVNNWEKLTRYIKLLRKYNKLETEYEALNDYVKNHCFDKLIEKLGEPLEIKRLREDNKRLRIKVKELKNELIKKKECISDKKRYISCKVSSQR